MDINRYQYNVDTEEFEITDTFSVSDNGKILTTVYLASDDPTFSPGVVQLNKAKRTDCINGEIVEIYSTNLREARIGITNYIKNRIKSLQNAIDRYTSKQILAIDYFPEGPKPLHFATPADLLSKLEEDFHLYDPENEVYIYLTKNDNRVLLNQLKIPYAAVKQLCTAIAIHPEWGNNWNIFAGEGDGRIYDNLLNSCEHYSTNGFWYDTKELIRYYTKQQNIVMKENKEVKKDHDILER